MKRTIVVVWSDGKTDRLDQFIARYEAAGLDAALEAVNGALEESACGAGRRRMTRMIGVEFSKKDNVPFCLWAPDAFRDAFQGPMRRATFREQCDWLRMLHPGVRIWEIFS